MLYNVLRLEEQGVTLRDDLIKKKKNQGCMGDIGGNLCEGCQGGVAVNRKVWP